jgi:AcrR family transcriptional regulator
MRASTVRRRDAILEAALECFDELGFEATGVQEIRARSGASVGSIYHHFAGKEQIAAELFLAGIAAYQRALGEVPAADGAQAWVRGIVRAHLRWCAGDKRMARFLDAHPGLEVVLAIEEPLAALNAGFFAHLRETIEPWAAAGELTPLPLEILAPVLVGPVHAFSRRWLAGRTRLSLRRAEDLLGDAAWGAVRPRS